MSTLPEFEYARPATLTAASRALSPSPTTGGAAATAVVYAGGVDLLDLMKDRIVEPRRLVNLKSVAGVEGAALRAIAARPDGSVVIGALATLADIAASPVLGGVAATAALVQSAGQAATPAVRNLATLGGNLVQAPRCWYFRHEAYPCLKKPGGSQCFALDGENRHHAVFTEGERCVMTNPSTVTVALVALDARVTVRAADGASRELPVVDFLKKQHAADPAAPALAHGEIVVAVTIPAAMAAAGSGWRSAYLKVREKQSFDWPLADVAVAVKLAADGATIAASRVVLGAVAAVPRRVEAVEKALEGRRLDDAKAIADIAQTVADGTRPLAQNAYKTRLMSVLVRRALAELATPPPAAATTAKPAKA